MSVISKLIADKRVLLCVGCGGVGKTTTAAALALMAAKSGKRVICLTIDPAKRLAQSLGLPEMTREEAQVEPRIFQEAGVSVPGSLTVMMLDTKATFDDIVKRHSSSNTARDSILNNRIYQYVSTSLAGTQEYMAMEKLQSLRDDPRFDLVVLDTPPTANALDFLDAPERMIAAIDSPAMRWFVQSFANRGSFSLLNKGSQLVLKAVAKITGAEFLDQLAGFLAAMHDLFGGFTERARRVALALRSRDVAFVLVTSPDPMAITEINFFADRLQEATMPRDVFVVNRVHVEPEPLLADAAEDLAQVDLVADARLLHAIRHAHDEARALAMRDAAHLVKLRTGTGAAHVPTILVRAFDGDVHDVRMLDQVAQLLGSP